MAQPPIYVFLSAGSPATERQQQFVTQLQNALPENFALKRAPFAARIEETIKYIEATLSECSGAIILAFERVYVEKGEEFRGGQLPRRTPKPLTNVKLTTVWNQIEAALAELRGLPLLIMFEDGLRIDGFLEHNTWRPLAITLDTAQLSSDGFRERITDWKTRVEDFHRNRARVARSARRGRSIGIAAALLVTLAGVALGAAGGGWLGYREGTRIFVKP
jgi:hypothetical protein